MGKIDLSVFKKVQESQQRRESGGDDSNRIGYFKLKDNNDRALVRICVDRPEDLDIERVHRLSTNGRFVNYNCKRDPTDPISVCPFCAAGSKASYRLFLPLINYKKQDDGTTTPAAEIWDRASFGNVDTITDYMAAYDPEPLSDHLFTVERHGAAGSINTTYGTTPANPNVYKPEFYPKDKMALFDGYTSIGHSVVDLPIEEMERMVADGGLSDASSGAQITPRNTVVADSDLPFDPPASPAYGTGEAVRPRRAY